MAQDSIYLGVVQETNTTIGIYKRGFVGDWVVALDMDGGHCRGVALFCQELKHFAVEAYQQHGPNFFIFQMTTGYRH